MTEIEIWPVGRQTGIMACRTWHYSGTLPTTAWCYGYWRGPEFDGVIAFRRQWVGPATHSMVGRRFRQPGDSGAMPDSPTAAGGASADEPVHQHGAGRDPAAGL